MYLEATTALAVFRIQLHRINLLRIVNHGRTAALESIMGI
jgi:hypothetical protein